MSTLAGKVANIAGLVQVKNPTTGTVTPLKQGDEVFVGDIIMSSSNGSITLSLANGDLLTLGRDMQMVLNEDVTGTAAMTDTATEGAVNVEALQLAVLQGNFDALEATAAGGEATPDASANAGATNSVDRLGLEGDVTSGFETTTSPVVIEQTEDPVIVQQAAVVVPPVEPPPEEIVCDKEMVGREERSDVFGFLFNSEFDLTLVLGGTTCITNFDFSDDAFDLSLVLEAPDANNLDEYLTFDEVTIDGQEKTVITVDSNGETTAGGDISTIYVDVQTGGNNYWKILVDGDLESYHSD